MKYIKIKAGKFLPQKSIAQDAGYDLSMENIVTLCSSFDDGKIRHFDSMEITLKKNHTINFNTNKK